MEENSYVFRFNGFDVLPMDIVDNGTIYCNVSNIYPALTYSSLNQAMENFYISSWGKKEYINRIEEDLNKKC